MVSYKVPLYVASVVLIVQVTMSDAAPGVERKNSTPSNRDSKPAQNKVVISNTTPVLGQKNSVPPNRQAQPVQKKVAPVTTKVSPAAKTAAGNCPCDKDANGNCILHCPNCTKCSRYRKQMAQKTPTNPTTKKI